MKGKGSVNGPVIKEAHVLALEWPDGRRAIVDVFQDPVRCPRRLRRLILAFGVKVEITGLRRRWDRGYLMPRSEPYEPPPKEGKRR